MIRRVQYTVIVNRLPVPLTKDGEPIPRLSYFLFWSPREMREGVR